MKRVQLHITLLLTLCSSVAFSQSSGLAKQGLRFYEALAHRDAEYEHNLRLSNHQDELDYWRDQKNFERNLGTADFASYLIYMRSKKEAYLAHLQNCNSSCGHSELYYEKAREYLSTSDFDRLLTPKASEVVQNIGKKEQ